MPSSEHFTVKGQSPYKQKNGVFEVEFAITEANPTDEQIAQKSFLPIWREKTHLHIKNGEVETTLGSESNPLPEKIYTFTNVWIIIVDHFSTLGSSFEFEVPKTMRKETKQSKTDSKPSKIKSSILVKLDGILYLSLPFLSTSDTVYYTHLRDHDTLR